MFYQGYDCSHLALLLAQEHQGIEEELAHWLRIAAFKPILIQYACKRKIPTLYPQ